MITKLAVFDGDGTLLDTPEPDEGKKQWSDTKGMKYPHIGWWSKPESLDLNVFDIGTFPEIERLLNTENNHPNTYVVLLTSRMEKLRPQFEDILDKNRIRVDKLDMQKDNRSKGQKILDYIKEFPELKQIDVYDDRDKEIESYRSIVNQIPEHITFNIFFVNEGKISLVEHKSYIVNTIKEEIENFFGGIYSKKL